MLYLTFLLFNICIGSFLNTLIYRLPRKINFLKGRSFCPNCNRKISWYDNIPILSFVLLKGKCRKCHSHISWRYPAIEILTGFLSLLVFISKFSPTASRNAITNLAIFFDFLSYLFLTWGLIVIFFIDLDWKIIPDEIVLPLTTVFIIRIFLFKDWVFFLSGLGAFFFFLIIFLITKGEGIGFGDVKLALLNGLALGWPNIVIALYVSFLTGAFVSIILLLTKRAKLGQKIPFGPFLVLGTIITLLWAEKIINLIAKKGI